MALELPADEPLPLSFGTEPVEAFRWFAVQPYARLGGLVEPRLHSMGVNGIWPPRAAPAAECKPVHKHEAPSAGCDCGYWAFRDRKYAEDMMLDDLERGTVLALARVRLWGRVVECARGYRAQHAYPVDLTVCTVDPATSPAGDLARIYGVPATTRTVPERKPPERAVGLYIGGGPIGPSRPTLSVGFNDGTLEIEGTAVDGGVRAVTVGGVPFRRRGRAAVWWQRQPRFLRTQTVIQLGIAAVIWTQLGVTPWFSLAAAPLCAGLWVAVAIRRRRKEAADGAADS